MKTTGKVIEVAGSALELGLAFVPVPGLQPAFTILKYIWKSVEKASDNKGALHNLAVSSTDIFKAVNYVLLRNEMNDYAEDLLDQFKKVLEDIRAFTENYVDSSVFRLLIKNVDFEGKIEFFQNRLQSLSMAFNVGRHLVAFADLKSEISLLGKRFEETHRLEPLPPPATVNQERGMSMDPNNDLMQRPEIFIHDYRPQRVRMTYSLSFNISMTNNIPSLASSYYEALKLSTWGIEPNITVIDKRPSTFTIISPQGQKLWTWTLTNNMITAVDLNPEHSDWKDHMDIIFLKDSHAAAWFSWLIVYTTVDRTTQLVPPTYDVKARTTYHWWIQKTPTSIQDRRTSYSPWKDIVHGHVQSSRAYATHLTYVSISVFAFVKVYLSGNTLVHERTIRPDIEEPTTAWRYCFETEAIAQAWYSAWKNCVINVAGENEPCRITQTLFNPRTIQVFNRKPILASALWTEIDLRQFGLQQPKSVISRTQNSFTVANVSTKRSWMQRGNCITISSAIASLPDWHQSLELVFRDTEASNAWFTYLMGFGTSKVPPTLPPPTEQVSVKETAVCWIVRTKNNIVKVRTAMSGEWENMFRNYKSMEVHPTSLRITSTSILPCISIYPHREELILERRAYENDLHPSISRVHQFSSENEARTWYEMWKEDIRERIS